MKLFLDDDEIFRSHLNRLINYSNERLSFSFLRFSFCSFLRITISFREQSFTNFFFEKNSLKIIRIK